MINFLVQSLRITTPTPPSKGGALVRRSLKRRGFSSEILEKEGLETISVKSPSFSRRGWGGYSRNLTLILQPIHQRTPNLLHISNLQIIQTKWPKRHANQAIYLQTQMFHYFSNFAIFTFFKRNS